MNNEDSTPCLTFNYWQFQAPNIPWPYATHLTKPVRKPKHSPSWTLSEVQTMQAHPKLIPNHNQSQASFLSLLSQAVFLDLLGRTSPYPQLFQKASLCEYNKPFPTLLVCVHMMSSVLTSGPNLGWGFISLLWVNTTPWSRKKAVSTYAGQAGRGLFYRG